MRAVVACLALLVAQQAAADDDGDNVRSIGSRYFLSLGFSIGSRDPPASDTIEDWVTLALGVPVGNRRQLVIAIEGSDERVDDMPTFQHRGRMLLGLRITPWAPERKTAPWFSPTRYGDLSALYFTALAGKESRQTITYEMGQREVYSDPGLIIGVDAGYVPFQGADWGFGLELTGRLTRNEDGTELAYGYGLVVYLMK